MWEVMIDEVDDLEVSIHTLGGTRKHPLSDRTALPAWPARPHDNGNPGHYAPFVGSPTLAEFVGYPTNRYDSLVTSSPARLWRLPSWLLNQVARSGNRLVSHHLGELERRGPYAVLSGLEEVGPTSQADLVRRTGIDGSDMVTIVNQLEHDNTATRQPDPADRRRNSIAITIEGRQHLAELDRQVEAAQAALLEPLAPAERTQLMSLLRRLLEHHEGDPPPRPQ